MTTTRELDRKHVFHSWSAQAEISPMVITAARGSYVWDDEDLGRAAQLAGPRRPRSFVGRPMKLTLGRQSFIVQA